MVDLENRGKLLSESITDDQDYLNRYVNTKSIRDSEIKLLPWIFLYGTVNILKASNISYGIMSKVLSFSLGILFMSLSCYLFNKCIEETFNLDSCEKILDMGDSQKGKVKKLS